MSVERISIALATFNGGRFLREQLVSLAGQTLAPLEVVVGDDGSSDGTMGLLEDFAREAPFEVRIHQNDTNLGFGENFLRLASMCRGSWIAFCDQDDVWLPGKLERCSEIAASHPDAALISHSAAQVDEHLRPLPHRFPDHRRLTSTGPLGNPPFSVLPGFSCLVLRSLLERVPYEDRPRDRRGDGSRQTHDYFVCNVANTYGTTVRVPDTLALYRRHEASVSGQPGVRVPFRNMVATIARGRADHLDLLARRVEDAGEYRRFHERILERLKDGEAPRGFALRTADAVAYYRFLEEAYRARTRIYADGAPWGDRMRALSACVRRRAYGGAAGGRGFGAGALLKDLASAVVSF